MGDAPNGCSLSGTSAGANTAMGSMERALSLEGPKLIVCGNAPTFLLRLVEADEDLLKDIAVVGVPVGFVNVVESKQRLYDSGVPCIASSVWGGAGAATSPPRL